MYIMQLTSSRLQGKYRKASSLNLKKLQTMIESRKKRRNNTERYDLDNDSTAEDDEKRLFSWHSRLYVISWDCLTQRLTFFLNSSLLSLHSFCSIGEKET